MGVEIHPTALVAKGAELADGVSIGAYSIIGEHARIGARTQILSHVVIENGPTLTPSANSAPLATRAVGWISTDKDQVSTTMAANSHSAATLSPTIAWPANLKTSPR